jgi:hypothetical protein
MDRSGPKGRADAVLHVIQSRSLRCPIIVHSERCIVSTYVRKNDSARTGGLPVLDEAVRGSRRLRRFGRQNPDKHIRALNQVRSTRNDHGRPNLCLHRTGKHADDNITGLQFESSVSSTSSRLRDAVLKSAKSSSDQESDQSILRLGESVARRSARPKVRRQHLVGDDEMPRPAMLLADSVAFPWLWNQYTPPLRTGSQIILADQTALPD